jgi:hypothetical protein
MFVVIEDAEGMFDTGAVFGPYHSMQEALDAKAYAQTLDTESSFSVRSLTLDIAGWWSEREDLQAL